jgi:hypothetical protein
MIFPLPAQGLAHSKFTSTPMKNSSKYLLTPLDDLKVVTPAEAEVTKP